MAKLNEKYSYGDWSGQDLRGVNPSEFNDTEIIGSAFGISETPFSEVLPAITGVIFTKCNLDNCVIPSGNTIGDGCCHNQHTPMNDGENWVVNEQLEPIEPFKKDRFINLGLSIDPKDIPDTKVKEPITIAKKRELREVQ